MKRFCFYIALLACAFTNPLKAQHVESLGVFGGFNVPFTLDAGLQKDPRYFSKFTFRGSPFGIQYGYDFVGYGFLISPMYMSTGQQYVIQNTTGGDVGRRDIRMDYFMVPVALKLHINDLSFFRLSMVAAGNFNYLIRGQETISHFSSKIRYPSGVTVPTGAGYEVTYDGVFVPEVANEVYVSKDKFKPFTFSASVGMRADFDFAEEWSLSFDGRATFGIFDPRKADYLDQLRTPAGSVDVNGRPGAPDLFGQRREVILSAFIGISRILKIKQEFKPKHSPNMPKNDAPKPRNFSKRPGKR